MTIIVVRIVVIIHVVIVDVIIDVLLFLIQAVLVNVSSIIVEEMDS